MNDSSEVGFPLKFNRAGVCCLCGETMGYYDTKYVSMDEGKRLMCFHSPPYGCGARDMPDQDAILQQFFFYSDG